MSFQVSGVPRGTSGTCRDQGAGVALLVGAAGIMLELALGKAAINGLGTLF